MKIRTACMAAITVTALLAAGCGGDNGAAGDNNDGEVYELKLATPLSENSLHSQLFQTWADRVDELTDGRFKVEPFYSSSLLETLDIFPGVGEGRADLGVGGESYYPAELPLWTFGQRPFVTRNSIAQAKTAQQLSQTNEEMLKEINAMGVQPLIVTSSSTNSLVSKTPITSVDQLDGLSVRAAGNTAKALASVGADVKTIDAGATFEALERGVVDAVGAIAPNTAQDFGLFDAGKHLTDPGLGEYSFILLVMNKQTYDDFPDDIREAIDTATQEYYDDLEAEWTAYEAELCSTLVEQGVTVSAWATPEQDEWREQVQDEMAQAYLDDMAAQGIGPQAEELVSEYEDLLAENSADSSYQPMSETCKG
jgi:TRAP-type C4-dicarboxylate transport system substrate-binding protein